MKRTKFSKKLRTLTLRVVAALISLTVILSMVTVLGLVSFAADEEQMILLSADTNSNDIIIPIPKSTLSTLEYYKLTFKAKVLKGTKPIVGFFNIKNTGTITYPKYAYQAKPDNVNNALFDGMPDMTGSAPQLYTNYDASNKTFTAIIKVEKLKYISNSSDDAHNNIVGLLTIGNTEYGEGGEKDSELEFVFARPKLKHMVKVDGVWITEDDNAIDLPELKTSNIDISKAYAYTETGYSKANIKNGVDIDGKFAFICAPKDIYSTLADDLSKIKIIDYNNDLSITGDNNSTYMPEIIASGTCGDNLTWTLDSDGLLTISGTGDMYDYSHQNSSPWYSYSDTINAVEFEGEVTRIGNRAFEDSPGLTSITIPDGVTSIGDYAFSGCTGPTSITIPNSVTNIGSYAFSGCTGLTTVYYSGSYEQGRQISKGSNNNPLTSAKWFYNYVGDETGIVACGTCGDNLTWKLDSNGLLTISGTGDMYDFSYQNSSPWYSYSDTINAVEFEGEVTRIGDYAFSYCTGLTSVIIPEGVTSIGDWAFSYCTGLTSITISDSVTLIRDGAFYYCTGLESITVDGGNKYYHSAGNCLIETASKTLVAGCKNSIIPNDTSVTSIGDEAFYNCEGLTSITIPEGVTSIGILAFHGCTGLTSITIPDSVTLIRDGAFYNCEGLTSITIPNSVTTIGNHAFSGCTGLTSVTIGNSVTSIGEGAFNFCIELTSITIPDSVTSIGDYAFSYCTGLTSVTIPNSVTIIGNHAFSGCTGLTSITIPDSVTSIGYGAFAYCTGLTSITIPDGVTSIGYMAFCGCTGLTTVYYTGSQNQRNKIEIEYDNEPLVNANWVYNYDPSAIIGDINGDGQIDANDLTLMVNSLISGEEYNKAYDLNNDGNVNILDLIALKKQLANIA